MYEVNNIDEGENIFKVKIDEKFHNFPRYQNAYKTGKYNNYNNTKNNTYNYRPNSYIKIAKPHAIMKRAKMKWFALQKLVQVPNMSNSSSNKNNKETKSTADIDASSKQPATMHYIIDNLMVLQHSIISLADFINRCSRLQLLFIFFQSALSIIFNSYNLVMYFLKLAFDVRTFLPPSMALLFYAYLIFCSLLDILLTIIGFSMVFNSIERTIKIVNALMLYANSELMANKLISGTVTYIIILVQYSDMPRIKKSDNDTETH